jgi:hypothetical protein
MCRAVLSHELAAAASLVQLLEGGLGATTAAAPPCRHGFPSGSSVSTPVSLLLLLLAPVLALGGLASEPGIFSYAVLCCCCSAHPCAAIAVVALLELVL